MVEIETATISSKGQIVIPQQIITNTNYDVLHSDNNMYTLNNLSKYNIIYNDIHLDAMST